jgi:SAM-dependent MidA family methyltransferase
VRKIVAEIEGSGPMTFARFMDLALYDPDRGYYTRPDDIMESRIGWSGDYYTSCDVHPMLAQALFRQVQQVDALLERPDPFAVVEMGAGKGLLARDFLRECAIKDRPLLDRLRYHLIERSPAMRAAQRSNLDHLLTVSPCALDHVCWLDALEEMASNSITGAFLSNELVDAFPVHRVRIEQGVPREVRVGFKDGRFVEHLSEPSPAVREYLEDLNHLGIRLREGQIAEINLHALEWMKHVARILARGIALTIDYGHTAQDLYGPERSRGSLLCYHEQRLSDDPYTRVGLQDLTAHVNFTALAATGDAHGLRVAGFTNQMSFLIGLGVEEAMQELEPGSPDFQGIIHLLRPDGMGSTFKVLIQQKGLDHARLDGLRYKPFFGTALGKPSPGVAGHSSLVRVE